MRPEQKGGCADGCGCFFVGISIIILIFYVITAVEDARIRKAIDAQRAAREALDRRYRVELAHLDDLYEGLPCTQFQKDQIIRARDYHHTKEEASHSGRDEYRWETFEELTNFIAQMEALIQVMREKPRLSPKEASAFVENFRQF